MLIVATFGAYRSFVEESSNTVSRIPIPTDRKTLAVLPFNNLGAPEDEYFADGITDEITSRLASVRELGVISRTSAMTYKGVTKRVSEIAEELGVDYILIGSMHLHSHGKATSVRITSQLISVAKDAYIWSKDYDRTTDRIFEVQTDIAKHVLDTLGIALLGKAKETVYASPTESPEAYDYYLRAKNFGRRNYQFEDMKTSIALCQSAIELDPDFSQAYAELANQHANIFWFNYDVSEKRLELAENAARKAIDLDPGSADAHVAMANYYYHGIRDYEEALSELDMAETIQPNHPLVHQWRAAVKRRQSKWTEALESYNFALVLEPRDPTLTFETALTYRLTRQYEKADSLLERCASLFPGRSAAYVMRADLYISWNANPDSALAMLERAKENVPENALASAMAETHIHRRDYVSALENLKEYSSAGVFDDTAMFYNKKAFVFLLMSNEDSSLAYFDLARRFAERRLRERPNSSLHLRELARANAGLGRNNDAASLCENFLKEMTVSRDAIAGVRMLEEAAKTFAMLGDNNRALELLDQALSVPGFLSVNDLRLNPIFDPLRDDDRFVGLLMKYDKAE